MIAPTVFDETPCQLGEGPLWHPGTGRFFWFDILSRRLCTRDSAAATRHWQFDEMVSAAGWIDDTRLLIASETQLATFDLDTAESTYVCALELDNPLTRSNDGRADPFGGFWIGTMGKAAEPGAGAIYRYYRGELRQLYSDITVTNAICFSPDGLHAYFADTRTHIIQRVALDQTDGWPHGDPAPWLDLTEDRIKPDGAVIDAAGNLWNAQYGHGRIVAYRPDASVMLTIDYPVRQTTCPAFGGADMTTLYCTSATQGLDLVDGALDGMTFTAPTPHRGQAEHRVIL